MSFDKLKCCRFYKIINVKSMIFFIMFIVSVANRSEASSGDVQLQLYMSNELRSLPEYCQVRLTEIEFDDQYKDINGRVRFPPTFQKALYRWRNSIGLQNWTYFHHYCFGVKEYNEYTQLDYNLRKSQKNQKMKRALDQFDFMRRARLSNFPLWYDLYRYESLIYSELGNPEKASWALKESLKHRPRKK